MQVLISARKRDTKGLYKLALAGKIKNFTGINSPYEAPANPDLHLNTENKTVLDCLDVLKSHLIANKNIGIGLNTTVSLFTS
jgi:adenylylsulfate kinase